jgi:DNA polymerase I-like protein with 3'-5' exonuclease and polymerase domains
MRVFQLENKTLRPLGDMTINGFLINKQSLAENIVTYTDNAEEQRMAMIDAFTNDSGKGVQEKIRDINVIQKTDEIVINWNSSTQKKAILQYMYPKLGIESTAKASLKKLIKDKEDKYPHIKSMIDNNYESVITFLVNRHITFLIKSQMYIKAGTLNLNFNSPSQLLDFFKVWYPDLTGVGVKALKRLKHPVVMAYKKYSKANKLVTSFGVKMYDYIESDGRIHGSFTQIVPSGSRLSSKKPNIQQSPGNTKFRRMYIPRKGWKLVDSDYSSLELMISAYLSKDKNMLEAINKGYDMHSYCCVLLFGDKWVEAGESITPVNKPVSEEGARMRKLSKMLSFGLIYGSGVSTFSDNANITIAEGKKLMAHYFTTFSELAVFFKKTGSKALHQLYVREPYFGRVRFFNKPKNGMESSHINNAAMNYKPQAVNGSIMKYALCLMKKYIEDNDIDHKVKILLTVHDQSVCSVREDYAVEWSLKQTELMEKAALYAIPEGTLKSETDIIDFWKK